LKYGVTLVLELDMKNLESSDLVEKIYTRYNIYCNDCKIHSDLTEEQYFDTMEDLAIQFYKTGSPSPGELATEIIGVTQDGKTKNRWIKQR